LDCDFEEGLFYKVLPDYNYLIPEARKKLDATQPFLVMDQVINESIKTQLSEHFSKDDIFINKNNSNLMEFLAGRICW
jgi:hypothetical protein